MNRLEKTHRKSRKHRWRRGDGARRSVSLTLSAGALALGVNALGAEPDARPNILFILTDDQGWAESSVPIDPAVPHGSCPYLETPHIERLAGEGMRFTDGYASAPICTPTRRSVLCGMTTARQRGTEFPSAFDPREHLTIPRALKAVDPAYRCAHFGKWGSSMEAAPEEAGYDESDGITGNFTGDFLDWKAFFQRKQAGTWTRIAGEPFEDPKRTFSITDRAVDFMRRQAGASRPFYAQVSYYAVHDQIQARAETLAKYREKGTPPRDFPLEFAAMLEDLDVGIGRLLQAVDELGIADNTFVFLASDNGGHQHRWNNPLYRNRVSGTRSQPTSAGEPAVPAEVEPDERLPDNYPLRGAKQWLYEGGIRVPFLARGPGIEGGALTREPVVLYDLLPTFVDMAGGDPAALPGDIDGGSLKPLLLGTGGVRRALPGLVFHRPLLRFRGGSPLPHMGMSAYRAGDWKLVVDWVAGEKELFNLRRDPGEAKNLAAAQPAETEALFSQLMDYLDAVDAEQPQAQLESVGLKTRNTVTDPKKIANLNALARKALQEGRTPQEGRLSSGPAGLSVGAHSTR
ncbi:MAG: sulfatase [Lentisphaerae bacterium]|nr:sulfatase [Lentisphaerota bacterium]